MSDSERPPRAALLSKRDLQLAVMLAVSGAVGRQVLELGSFALDPDEDTFSAADFSSQTSEDLLSGGAATLAGAFVAKLLYHLYCQQTRQEPTEMTELNWMLVGAVLGYGVVGFLVV